MSAAFWFMVAVVTTAGLSFVVVMAWIADRTKKREAEYLHYRDETVRKMAESGDSSGALEYLKEIDGAEQLKARNAMRLGGLITIAAGTGLMIFLNRLVPTSGLYMVGCIPILVGVALLIFTELMMRQTGRGR